MEKDTIKRLSKEYQYSQTEIKQLQKDCNLTDEQLKEATQDITKKTGLFHWVSLINLCVIVRN